MTLENIVPSLQLCKELKENGFDLERWKPIRGHEGLYEISDLGRVKSVKRKNGMGSRKDDRIIKPKVNRQGRLEVGLHKDDEQKMFLVHRLVAKAFISNPENKRCINHKDGKPTNNCMYNLEWCTHAENNEHARANRLMGGSRTNTAKLTEDKVKELRGLWPSLSIKELSMKYGIGKSTVSKIIKREYWRYV